MSPGNTETYIIRVSPSGICKLHDEQFWSEERPMDAPQAACAPARAMSIEIMIRL
jgi:hypothetical protein